MTDHTSTSLVPNVVSSCNFRYTGLVLMDRREATF